MQTSAVTGSARVKPRVKVPFFVHLLNPLMKLMLRSGVRMGGGSGGPSVVLLTLPGRKTGKLHTTPVGIFEHEGHRYLFGTFGEAKWVRNLRAAGHAVLTSKGHKETVVARELGLEERGRVLWNGLSYFMESRMSRSF